MLNLHANKRYSSPEDSLGRHRTASDMQDCSLIFIQIFLYYTLSFGSNNLNRRPEPDFSVRLPARRRYGGIRLKRKDLSCRQSEKELNDPGNPLFAQQGSVLAKNNL